VFRLTAFYYRPMGLAANNTLFATTHWSVFVTASKEIDSPHAREALETLCRTYWYPLYAYVRRQGHAPEDAEDLTQAFFARLLEKKYVANARRERGRFRTFLLTSLKRGKTLVTLAPEATTPAMIRRLVEAGVVVAAGHTNADYDTIRQALASGLTGFTHLFNAMSPLTSREPGAVGAALEDAASWCGLIADGRHVHPAVLRIALRARRLDRFMLVTDAMSAVGTLEKTFTVQGRS